MSYIEVVKPFIAAGRFSINVQNVTYIERRDDGTARVYFVGQDDFLSVGLPEAEQLAPLVRDLSVGAAPAAAPEPLKPERLQEIGSRVEELQRSIEETARKVLPPESQ